jgi:hypothetical protein
MLWIRVKVGLAIRVHACVAIASVCPFFGGCSGEFASCVHVCTRVNSLWSVDVSFLAELNASLDPLCEVSCSRTQPGDLLWVVPCRLLLAMIPLRSLLGLLYTYACST